MKSWKTSLAGLLGGLILTFGPNVGARLSGEPAAPPITFQNYGPGLVLAAIGLLSKDYNKTNAMNPVQTQTAIEERRPIAPSNPSSNYPSTR